MSMKDRERAQETQSGGEKVTNPALTADVAMLEDAKSQLSIGTSLLQPTPSTSTAP